MSLHRLHIYIYMFHRPLIGERFQEERICSVTVFNAIIRKYHVFELDLITVLNAIIRKDHFF